MNNTRKTLIYTIVLVALLGISYISYQLLLPLFTPQNSPVRLPDENEAQRGSDTGAPDFAVYDIDGNEVRLSDFLGTPVVLNFWASWCPPCKGEMPDFDALYEEYKDRVAFVMVDLVDGQRETVETGSQHVEDQGFTFPVYYDTEQKADAAYGIMSIPMTLFIDGDGYLVGGYQRAIDREILRAGLDVLLEKK